MASEAKIIERVRLELGDLTEPFRISYRGNGQQDDFDLPARNVLPSSLTVYRVNDPVEVGQPGTTTPYALTTDFTLDSKNGIITFKVPPPQDALIMVEGNSYGIFSDDEIAHFVHDAVSQHLNNRTVRKRYRDGHGFIKYDSMPMELEDMPEEENILVGLLASIEALWALSTDASLDIDVQTAEGTSLPRGQRWRQLTAQIDLLTEKYKDVSLMMGVGLFAPEVLNLRRTSRTTGRLVPIFEEREYDEHGPPKRKVPPRGDRDVDHDGPHSPWFSGGWGF